MTHLDVKRAIEDVIPDAFETNKVVSLRFENINVKYSTTDLPNRFVYFLLFVQLTVVCKFAEVNYRTF